MPQASQTLVQAAGRPPEGGEAEGDGRRGELEAADLDPGAGQQHEDGEQHQRQRHQVARDVAPVPVAGGVADEEVGGVAHALPIIKGLRPFATPAGMGWPDGRA